MQRSLRAINEKEPGERWAAVFAEMWPSYENWFLREGGAARPTYGASIRALKKHMPELVPTYENLVELAGGGDLVARCLSLYCPTPYLTGCTQAVWLRDRPLLVRNYDYFPNVWEALILRTKWTGTSVVAMSDCGWGALDGVNEGGLCVSLAFGGRRVVGEGFGIPLIVRYILETCERTEEAERILMRVPSHMAYNVTVLDRFGQHVTAYVAPDHETKLSRDRVATNQQPGGEWSRYTVATSSVERFDALNPRVDHPEETAMRFIERFRQAPIHQPLNSHGWGTLYSAVYDPENASVDYRWPTTSWRQGVEAFEEGTKKLHFPRASNW
jgi:predicted choloylglycine hydrolase